jgi:hypothetical protein
VPRDQKPRRGNGDDDDDDDNDAAAAVAAVLITFIVSLFFAFGNLNSFAQVFVYTSYDKKEEQERSVFLNQLYPSNS